MTIVRWGPNLSAGEEDLDTGYQALVDLLNQLGKAVRRGPGHDEIGRRLDNLAASTEEHFRRKAEIIVQEGYPEAEHHQGLQEALIEVMRKFRGSFEGGAGPGPRSPNLSESGQSVISWQALSNSANSCGRRPMTRRQNFLIFVRNGLSGKFLHFKKPAELHFGSCKPAGLNS